MNTIKEFQDKYNDNKIWVIKRTPCRHYYINQKICGRLFYTAYQKITLCNVKKILGMSKEEWDKRVEGFKIQGCTLF